MTAAPQTRQLARRTGVAYLGIVIAGIFAEFFVRGSLVVPGDAVATAEAIAAAPGLFGLGVAADLLMITLDVGVAIGLFRLLREVDLRLALAATVFRLVQASILTANLWNLGEALRLAAGGSLGADTAAQVLAAVETHALVYDVGLIAFALACLTLARLLPLAGGPRALSVGLALTGGVYLVGSFAALFMPSALAVIDPFYAIAIVVEPAFAVWLIVRGGALGRARGANEPGSVAAMLASDPEPAAG